MIQETLTRFYVKSAGCLVLVAAMAKLVSSFGTAGILSVPDPILFINYRLLFIIVGIIELLVAFVCLFSGRRWWQLVLLAWLATSFLSYRLGLAWVGQEVCHCLGNLTDALRIPPQTADFIMKIALIYLLVGSYILLLIMLKASYQRDRIKQTAMNP